MRDGDCERVGAVNGVGFVGFRVGDADFTICQSKDDVLVGRPTDASHRRVLHELVADDLLLSPRLADLVDEDDVVRLRHRQFGRVGRPSQAGYWWCRKRSNGDADYTFFLFYKTLFFIKDMSLRFAKISRTN